MMKRILLALMLLPFMVAAQNKTLTVETATFPAPGFFPSSPSQFGWQGSTNTYQYVFRNNLLSATPGSPADTVLRMADLNKALKTINEDEMQRFPAIVSAEEGAFIYVHKNRYFRVNLNPLYVRYLNGAPDQAANVDFEKTSRRIAYTKGNNLYVSVEGRQNAVTSEQNPDIVYGSEKVHRNEFGITKGTFWAPGGKKLAFYRMDQTMVTDYPLVDISPRIASAAPVKYPMAGMTSHHVTVGIYDADKGDIIYLKTDGDPEHYLTNVTWSPDGRFIYIAELNRDQNHMQMNKFDVVTGRRVKTLFEERSEAYVEPQEGPFFLNNDPSKFLWLSRRDGFNHIYLYDSAGTMISQLTKGAWEVTTILGIDAKISNVFFSARKDHPLSLQVYSVPLKGGPTRTLTTIPGTHDVRISDDGRYLIDKYSNTESYQKIELTDLKGKHGATLFTAADPLKDYRIGKTSILTVKSEDGQDLYCRLIRPFDFDSTKKYPVIIYVYGGPHSQLITNSWLGGGGLFLNWLASKGYVVFTLDNRGTSARGAAFEQAIFRNLGVAEVSDQMKGVEYLKSLSYVDPERIGINGWSYGGFLSMSMMLRNPGVFKAVVAGGPVIDWKWYEVMYGERYMDTPESNPTGYEKASLLNYVNNLRGRLLIIQGYQDETVVPQNCLSFLKKCVDENKQLDFFIYPAHEHNVRGKDRIHLNQKIGDYFDQNLK